MRANVLGYLDAEIRGLQEAAEDKYRQLLSAARNNIKEESAARSHSTSNVASSIRAFDESIARLEALESRLSLVFPKQLEGGSI
jgi:hypothetical protein